MRSLVPNVYFATTILHSCEAMPLSYGYGHHTVGIFGLLTVIGIGSFALGICIFCKNKKGKFKKFNDENLTKGVIPTEYPILKSLDAFDSSTSCAVVPGSLNNRSTENLLDKMESYIVESDQLPEPDCIRCEPLGEYDFVNRDVRETSVASTGTSETQDIIPLDLNTPANETTSVAAATAPTILPEVYFADVVPSPVNSCKYTMVQVEEAYSSFRDDVLPLDVDEDVPEEPSINGDAEPTVADDDDDSPSNESYCIEDALRALDSAIAGESNSGSTSSQTSSASSCMELSVHDSLPATGDSTDTDSDNGSDTQHMLALVTEEAVNIVDSVLSECKYVLAEMGLDVTYNDHEEGDEEDDDEADNSSTLDGTERVGHFQLIFPFENEGSQEAPPSSRHSSCSPVPVLNVEKDVSLNDSAGDVGYCQEDWDNWLSNCEAKFISAADDVEWGIHDNEMDEQQENGDLDGAYDLLRQQLSEILPKVQRSTSGASGMSNLENDSFELADQNCASESDNPNATEIIINYNRSLTPIPEESEDESSVVSGKTLFCNYNENTSNAYSESVLAIGCKNSVTASNDTLFNLEDLLDIMGHLEDNPPSAIAVGAFQSTSLSNSPIRRQLSDIDADSARHTMDSPSGSSSVNNASSDPPEQLPSVSLLADDKDRPLPDQFQCCSANFLKYFPLPPPMIVGGVDRLSNGDDGGDNGDDITPSGPVLLSSALSYRHHHTHGALNGDADLSCSVALKKALRQAVDSGNDSSAGGPPPDRLCNGLATVDFINEPAACEKAATLQEKFVQYSSSASRIISQESSCISAALGQDIALEQNFV